MKTNPDSDPQDSLLEALLQDEGWQAANAAGKARALGVFRARQRLRRWSRWGGSFVALVVVMVCAAHWWPGRVAPNPLHLAEKASGPSVPPIKAASLTDEDLLAQFPEGSCFLAEVDGKKKLIFFDPEVEREYISDAGAQRAPNHRLTSADSYERQAP